MAQWHDILRFATSYSEANPDRDGADHAIGYVKEALAIVKEKFPGEELQNQVEGLAAYGQSLWRFSGLQRWRYRLTEDEHDLEEAVKTAEEALDYLQRARRQGGFPKPGLLAQAHLLSMLLLRMRDEDRMRPDQEGHQRAVLEIKEKSGDSPLEASWLRWYQALALVDAGDKDSAIQLAQSTVAKDAQLGTKPENWEIGRRQYALLRRFIEQYSPHFRDPALVGVVAQVLQSASRSNN